MCIEKLHWVEQSEKICLICHCTYYRLSQETSSAAQKQHGDSVRLIHQMREVLTFHVTWGF